MMMKTDNVDQNLICDTYTCEKSVSKASVKTKGKVNGRVLGHYTTVI